MKKLIFPGFVNFGGGDSCDTEVEIELSEAEENRLRIAARTEEEFNACEDVRDIYKRVYEALVASETAQIRKYNEEYRDMPSEWRIDKVFRVGISFPDEYAIN